MGHIGAIRGSILLGTATLPLVASAVACPATAFQPTNDGVIGCNGDRSWSYSFYGSGWDNSHKNLVRSGFADLEIAHLNNETILVDTTEATGDTHIDLNDLGAGVSGSTECFSTPSITISSNPSTWDNANRVRSTASHEGGHRSGLVHSGTTDSPDGNSPVMVTCVGSDPIGLSQDDNASMAYLFQGYIDTLSNTFTPNSGFEDGRRYWGGTTNTSINGSGGFYGRSWVSFKPQSSSEYMSIGSHFGIGNGNPGFTSRSELKQAIAGQSAHATLELYIRRWHYNNDPVCSDQYRLGLSGMNIRSNIGAAIRCAWTSTITPGNSWSEFSSLSNTCGNDNGTAVEIRIYGSGGVIGVDEARVEGYY